MAFGLGMMGLAPDAFWRLSPRELEAMVRSRTGAIGCGPALSRAEFDALRASFPDEEYET